MHRAMAAGAGRTVGSERDMNAWQIRCNRRYYELYWQFPLGPSRPLRELGESSAPQSLALRPRSPLCVLSENAEQRRAYEGSNFLYRATQMFGQVLYIKLRSH
jgi:hypothetical protein